MNPGDSATSPSARGADAAASSAFGKGPGLWTFFYAALWLNGALLACLILYSRGGIAAWPRMALWTLALGITAALTGYSRIVIHDILVGLSFRERLVLGIFILIFCLFKRICG